MTDPRRAPGHPGRPPRWAPAAKDGVGTALTPSTHGTSLVWYTIGRGILSEVYYPRTDNPCTRDLGLIVTAGDGFVSDERDDAEHRVECPVDGVPLYRLANACKRGRYRIEKEVFSHPEQDAVLQVTRFVPLSGPLEDYRLHALLNPHMGGDGAGNTAWVGDHNGVPMLFARRGGLVAALASTAGWPRRSAGFVGESDGRGDLERHGRLVAEYDLAQDGNVALVGEVDLGSCDGRFVLALGFGPDPDEAGHRALSALRDDPGDVRDGFVRGWRDWQAGLRPLAPGGGDRDLARVSTAVIRSHDDKAVPGAIVASLSTPWGEARGDAAPHGTGGYHLVWPRDLCEAAGGYLAVGAHAEAARVLGYLRATQRPDGHWPQNMRVGGAAFWEGIQLGETAIPVLLLDHLRREGALGPDEVARHWPMARRAVAYIVRGGPSTQQDRWENETGYTPFTLALVIAALLAAADLADAFGETEAGAYLRETADAWNASIEGWLYVTGTDLARRVGVHGYYARIIPSVGDGGPTPPSGRKDSDLQTSRDRGLPPDEVVSPDALALVRYGLRAADDPRIVDTIKVIDALLKVETPSGPSWRRYNGDGYGEHADGSPYDSRTRGIGRAWPLLTGERAHYELAAGRRDEAARLLGAMAAFAGDGGLIPEQVWDTDDIPERHLFRGRPTGSAMPLVWAHAEYLKLRRSLQEGRVFDRPPQPARRYLEDGVGSDKALWKLDHRRRSIAAGDTLRVEVSAPAEVRWTADGGATQRDQPTRDTTLGIHVADLPTAGIAEGGEVRFTIRWLDDDRREGGDFRVAVVPRPAPHDAAR